MEVGAMLRQDGSEYGVGVAQVLTGETGSSGDTSLPPPPPNKNSLEVLYVSACKMNNGVISYVGRSGHFLVTYTSSTYS